MGTSFLDRYFDGIDDWLGDPVLSKRLTKEKKLRELQSVEMDIWSKLMSVSGLGNTIGRTEATITLKTGVSYYQLPGNCRRITEFVLRNSDDPDIIEARHQSIRHNERGPGYEVVGPSQGIKIRPAPLIDADQDWTLVYQKGPVILHAATMGESPRDGSASFKLGIPDDGFGTVVGLPNYYVGSNVRVYESEIGAPQVREVIGSVVSPGSIIVRFPFDRIVGNKNEPKPQYEICPLQSQEDGLDEIYAMTVAMKLCTTRTQRAKQKMLRENMRDKLNAIREYWVALDGERLPSRPISDRREEAHVYDAG